ncbi:reverse rubrerythrin-1 [bacterium BMS3Abin15]|nr:reverse rubrerythrin-1 [bacterium BMS3Abin15]
MKTFICEICGDAYLGEEKPKGCPFCGAREAFIKEGKDTDPIVNQKEEIGEVSIKNLKEALDLEKDAVAIYNCMAGKADTYEIKAMYKRLAKVEMEHVSIICKLLEIEKPEIDVEECNEDDVENFKGTVDLEDNAVNLYKKFTKEATEKNMKILFTALAQAEDDHIKLIKNYLN